MTTQNDKQNPSEELLQSFNFQIGYTFVDYNILSYLENMSSPLYSHMSMLMMMMTAITTMTMMTMMMMMMMMMYFAYTWLAGAHIIEVCIGRQ